MGNLHSNSRTIRRHNSAVIVSRMSLGCSASASTTVCASDTMAHESSELDIDFVHKKDSRSRNDDDKSHRPSQSVHSNIAYAPASGDGVSEDASIAYHDFLCDFPEYRLTWILDTLRRSDYVRLQRSGETYVDYMGGALYPESLIRVQTEFLSHSILGNTHSFSNSSQLTKRYAEEARTTILAFFEAPPEEYTVVFTSNATAALKLVGESYPFTDGSSYVLCADSHNSVHGIREFATRRKGSVCYIPSTNHGGFDLSAAKAVLSRHRPQSKHLTPSLFALTGQSNITNSKNPLSIIEYAASLGFHTLLDAAALAPTSPISLTEISVDAMAISFYKMFGFPTGVGALVVKKTFLTRLRRPWFAGGTVDVVQVPGNIVTRSLELHEQFEDGTINYLTLPAVTDGLRFLSAYLPFLPLRLSCLVQYLTASLSQLKHASSGVPVVRILSRVPTTRTRSVGEQSDTGSTVSMIFFLPSGDPIPNSFIEYSASKNNISLRTGCMCNPGGAAAILGIQEDMQRLYPGVTLKDFELVVGRELGVVRVSLGLGSNFQDVWNVVRFVRRIGDERERELLWLDWTLPDHPQSDRPIRRTDHSM